MRCKGLAEKADVVFEGFRPGTVKKLGIDYDTMKKINPRIIYCSLSGYGQDGPYALLPGDDITYITTGGAFNLFGDHDGPPVIPFNYVGDFLRGGTLHAVIGILAALMARQKTGLGQYVDVSMTDGVVSLLHMLAVFHFQYGAVTERGTNRLAGQFPDYGVYQTKDGGYIALGCIEPHFWKNLCTAVGKEEFIPCPQKLGEKSKKIRSAMQEVFLTKTKEEWVA